MTVELSPTGEPAAPEHVGVAFRAMGFGVCFGLGVTAAVLWVVRTLQLSAPPDAAPSGPVFYLVLVAWLGGAGLATVAAFSLMRPLVSLYRRGGLSMVTGFATIVASLIAPPVDHFFGRAGLLGLSGTATLLALLVARGIIRRRV